VPNDDGVAKPSRRGAHIAVGASQRMNRFTLARLRRIAASLAADERGAAMTEATVLVGSVAVVAMMTFVAFGVALASNYNFARSYFLSPLP